MAERIPYAGTANTSTNILTQLPHAQRYHALQYTNENGTIGSTAYPINYDEVYNLKGRLLTLADATFTDPQQRKAFKDLTWQALKAWIEDIAQYATDGTRSPVDDGYDVRNETPASTQHTHD